MLPTLTAAGRCLGGARCWWVRLHVPGHPLPIVRIVPDR